MSKVLDISSVSEGQQKGKCGINEDWEEITVFRARNWNLNSSEL